MPPPIFIKVGSHIKHTAKISLLSFIGVNPWDVYEEYVAGYCFQPTPASVFNSKNMRDTFKIWLLVSILLINHFEFCWRGQGAVAPLVFETPYQSGKFSNIICKYSSKSETETVQDYKTSYQESYVWPKRNCLCKYLYVPGQDHQQTHKYLECIGLRQSSYCPPPEKIQLYAYFGGFQLWS